MATIQFVAEVRDGLLLALPREAERLHLRSGDKVSLHLDDNVDIEGETEVNHEMIATLREIAERQNGRRHTDVSFSDSLLREARSGAMWGYDPVED